MSDNIYSGKEEITSGLTNLVNEFETIRLTESLVIELLEFGLSVFNDDNEKFERWLTKENSSLGGVKPESLLENKKDIQDVMNCLNRIEYGNLS